MLRALDKNNNSLYAWETIKTQYPFYCPECKSLLIIKKGDKKEHHFAHSNNTICKFGIGESQLHLSIKRKLFLYLKELPNIKNCEIERYLKTVRPDLSMRINGIPVAIEIQCTHVDIKTIIHRMDEYYKKKIYVVWVFPFECNPWRDEKNIKDYEKFIHMLQFGKVYFYIKEDMVLPMHYSSIPSFRNGFSNSDVFVNPKKFFYKQKKRLLPYEHPIKISLDFKPLFRKQFNECPACYIYTDKLREWWKTKEMISVLNNDEVFDKFSHIVEYSGSEYYED